jgi:hypothetical protein
MGQIVSALGRPATRSGRQQAVHMIGQLNPERHIVKIARRDELVQVIALAGRAC